MVSEKAREKGINEGKADRTKYWEEVRQLILKSVTVDSDKDSLV